MCEKTLLSEGQPHSASLVGSTQLTGINRLRKMSLYSKGFLLIFLRPNLFFEGLGCGLPQPHPALKNQLRLMPYVKLNKFEVLRLE